MSRLISRRDAAPSLLRPHHSAEDAHVRPALDYSIAELYLLGGSARAGLCLVSFYIIVHCCGWTCLSCCCYTVQPSVDGTVVIEMVPCFILLPLHSRLIHRLLQSNRPAARARAPGRTAVQYTVGVPVGVSGCRRVPRFAEIFRSPPDADSPTSDTIRAGLIGLGRARRSGAWFRWARSPARAWARVAWQVKRPSPPPWQPLLRRPEGSQRVRPARSRPP